MKHGHLFVIPASQEPRGQFPDPAFWRIRTGIYNLLYKFGAAAESPQDPGGSGGLGEGNTTFYYLPDTPQYEAVDNLDPKVLSAMLLKISR